MKTLTSTTHTASRTMDVNDGVAKVTATAELTHFAYHIHDRKQLNKKARLYWEDNWTGSSASKEFVLGEHPEYGPRNVDPALDKAWDGYNKRHVRIVRDAIINVLAEMVAYRCDVKAAAVRYSRKAGCACGCSAGFVLSDELSSELKAACGAEYGIGDLRVRLRYEKVR